VPKNDAKNEQKNDPKTNKQAPKRRKPNKTGQSLSRRRSKTAPHKGSKNPTEGFTTHAARYPDGMIDIPYKNRSDGVSTIGTKKYGRRAT